MAAVNDTSVDLAIDSFDVSDHWLRVFDAVGSEGSFTAAGRRLGIGQPSVSHAVKQLERALGVQLFDRSETRIRLTDSGQELRGHVRRGFDVLDQGVRTVRRRIDEDQAIALSVSTSFATWWLLPRLAAFKAEHPDIALRCITSDNDDRVGRDDADVWIPHGSGAWPGLTERVLTAERILAVASPELARSVDTTDPRSLLASDLIHLEERYRPRFDWDRWFAAKGLAAPTTRSIVSNDYAVVVQAALDGQGVALGWDHIVGPLIEQGRLVPVAGPAIETDEPFVLLLRTGPVRPDVERLCDWLVRETA